MGRCFGQLDELPSMAVLPGDVVFRHACKLGFEGIVSKRLGSPYISGRSRHWIKSKNPAAPAVKREAEEDHSLRHRIAGLSLRCRLSAIGTKRTSQHIRALSAFGGKADIG